MTGVPVVPADRDGSDEIAPLTLVLGDEEFLVSRALEDLRRAVLAADPTAEVHEVEAVALDPVDLIQVLSPSLFGGRRLVILRSAQDLAASTAQAVLPLLLDADADATIVVQHLGGGRGKTILDAVRAKRPMVITCAGLTRAEERMDFLRNEVRRFSGRMTGDAAAALLDAVGSDLRELSAVVAQLVGDTDGRIDAEAVAAYHRGRAEVTGFAVADEVVVGNTAGALTNLRWALNVGVPPVLIADAIAEGVRSIARVSGAGSGDPFKLAPVLGMPPWKVKRARTQARGWTDAGFTDAMAIAAALNAEVKGAAVDAGYALEAAVRRIAALRSR
jgi:DNA polymerase-3 subunit delta